jgi:tetratricopeptide (TPR) repeat protein
LPAALIALLGLSALVFATDRNSKLEQRYRRWAEDATKEREELTQKILNDMQVLQSGQTNKTLDELIPPDDKRRVNLDQASTSARLYYEKLIALNPNEPEYRYHFANECANSKSKSDFQRGLSLMETLAPLNQTGFPKAHRWWAEYYRSLMQLNKFKPEQIATVIYSHAENCLKRESGDTKALILKGESAEILGRNDDAYQAYMTLFETDPFYYEKLITLHDRMKRPEANREVFFLAKGRFESRLLSRQEADEMSVDQWCRHWEAFVGCLVGMEDFTTAQEKLEAEVKRQTEDKDYSKQVFLKQLLAKVLVANQRKQSSNSLVFSDSDLDLIKKAKANDSKNVEVLQILTRMALSDQKDISDEAKKEYDPTTETDPPALVLAELGTVALAKKEYQKAITYMEKARSKQPNDWIALNNLAYVYLVADTRNPERALKLVDEAIRKIPNPDVAKKVMTNFLDTKGAALMQLNRMPEAIAAFEMALKDRPDNIKILENLIKCYEASNLSADVYKERLKQEQERLKNDGLKTPAEK